MSNPPVRAISCDRRATAYQVVRRADHHTRWRVLSAAARQSAHLWRVLSATRPAAHPMAGPVREQPHPPSAPEALVTRVARSGARGGPVRGHPRAVRRPSHGGVSGPGRRVNLHARWRVLSANSPTRPRRQSTGHEGGAVGRAGRPRSRPPACGAPIRPVAVLSATRPSAHPVAGPVREQPHPPSAPNALVTRVARSGERGGPVRGHPRAVRRSIARWRCLVRGGASIGTPGGGSCPRTAPPALGAKRTGHEGGAVGRAGRPRSRPPACGAPTITRWRVRSATPHSPSASIALVHRWRVAVRRRVHRHARWRVLSATRPSAHPVAGPVREQPHPPSAPKALVTRVARSGERGGPVRGHPRAVGRSARPASPVRAARQSAHLAAGPVRDASSGTPGGGSCPRRVHRHTRWRVLSANSPTRPRRQKHWSRGWRGRASGAAPFAATRFRRGV